MSEYTEKHAKAGLDAKLPKVECFANQFKDYEVVIDDPEFTSICPRTGLPDFGKITVKYIPNKLCIELKSFKQYMNAYRNLGIFQENAVNRILKDLVASCRPKWMEVEGVFNPRGGIGTKISASQPKN